MDHPPRHRLIARAAVLGLVLAHLGPASAQESTTGGEESGGAVAEEGSVVEGSPGGLDIGRGTVWLGVGVLAAIGLALAVASSDSGTSGTNGTSGTGGTSGSN